MRLLRPVICTLTLAACLAGCSSSGPTIAAFCAGHTATDSGYWSSYGPSAGLAAESVSAARWRGQFDEVADGLCSMRRRQQSGVSVQVDGASSPAAARREVLVAIRRIERLPAAH